MESMKGIALFTPGGDLVYCIDPEKRNRWHVQLCAALQEALNLAEPPHFLSPCYTATIDRWMHPSTQDMVISAEASPLVMRHQSVLNAVFNTEGVEWRSLTLPLETCNPLFLSHFQKQFPELWNTHNLILPVSTSSTIQIPARNLSDELLWSQARTLSEGQGFVLRLFISGHGAGNERILKRLHSILETSLKQPYTLKVVDIYKNPELAEADQISATPTLVKAWPLPVKKLVGDFQDASSLLGLLLASDYSE
jgi:circadian clock protein KaiB